MKCEHKKLILITHTMFGGKLMPEKSWHYVCAYCNDYVKGYKQKSIKLKKDSGG